MIKTLSALSAGILMLAATGAGAQETDDRGKAFLEAAQDCYRTYAKDVTEAEETGGIPAAVSALQNYLCLEDTQAASRYVRNADLVARYGERVQTRFSRPIAVDKETGVLITELQYTDISSTGWQDLLNAVSLNSDPYSVFVSPLPRLTQAAGRIVLEAIAADE